MTTDTLVSVIIPVYKVEEKYLRRCIESVLEQTYGRLEVILVDDGSPDESGDICESYAEIDKRVRVIHKVNGGVSSARNCGLKLATGDYVFFVDGDDSLKYNAIYALLQAAQKTNSDITICSCEHIKGKPRDNMGSNREQERLKTVCATEAIRDLSYNIQIFEELEPTAVWGKLYKKDIIQNLHFNENMSIGEDFVFNYFAICNSTAITYYNLKLYNYTYVENSLMNTTVYSPKLFQSFKELLRFESNQKGTAYSYELMVRCINIAFTIYLKIPVEKSEELHEIESYILKNRSKVLNDKQISGKFRIAVFMTYVSFRIIRWSFNLTKIARGR